MAKEIKIPTIGESINEVTILSWLVSDGDYVEMDDPLCELETDKATLELPAEVAGVIKIIAEEGDTLNIGDVCCSIDESAAAPEGSDKPAEKEEAKQEAPAAASAPELSSTSHATGHPSPAAAKILAEKGISPEAVSGSGKGGRITKEDAVKAEAQKAAPAAAPTATEAPVPSGGGLSRDTRSERMSRLRQTIAKRLVEVKNTTAMLTTFNEVDMTAIMQLRKQYKELFKEKHEIGLGFMSFFSKACTIALEEFPAVNGQIDGDHILYHDYCDIGIAVSTERGLVVPVIRNAEAMSLKEIEQSVLHYALKARDNKLSIDEMMGGTFTITNGGVFGSMLSTPIINGTQSAILGMHNIVQRPVAVNGQVEIRPMMYVALSYDHRIVDGKESVSFLVRVKQLLEDPARMLLQV